MGKKLLGLGATLVPTAVFAALFLAAAGGFSWWSLATLLVALGAGAVWLGGAGALPWAREPEARLGALAGCLPEPLLLLDARDCLQSFNPAAARLLGGAGASFAGQPLWALLPTPFAAALRPRVEQVRRERRPCCVELRHGDRSMEVRLFLAGDGIGLQLRDVSERSRELEAARELARTRAELLLLASHELRTPLGALLLQLQGLERAGRRAAAESTPDRLRGGVERAARQAERLAQLIDSMLDLSRLESGGLQLDRELVDLSALARELAGRHAAQAEQAGCALTLDLQPGVSGHWDRLRLEQVATNLLSNALKYGAGRPVQLLVRGDAETAWLTVRDQGIGIAREQQQLIFGRFQRTAEARRFSGVGVGLYLTRQLVLAHGGRIDVESVPGQGATFAVALPRSLPAQQSCEERALPRPVAGPDLGVAPGAPAALPGD